MSDLEKLQNAWTDWLKTEKQERFGQYLINRKVVPDHNELWNEPDENNAYAMAVQILGL